MSKFVTVPSLPPDPSFVRTYGVKTSKGWYRHNCPMCGDTDGKLYVNLTNSFYKCFRGCAKEYFNSTQLSQFGVQLSNSVQKKDKVDRNFPRISLENESLEANIVKGYLEDRKVEEHVRRVFEIEGSVVFGSFAVALPIITPLRRTPFWYYRLIGHPELKHFSEFPKSDLFYGHPRVLTAKSLFIMEGIFDILCSLPFSSICSFSKVITDGQLDLLKYFTCEEILICLDGSVDFKRKFRSLLRVKIETGRRVGIVKLPSGKDPANVGPAVANLEREYI
jgi:hypothetical protein